MQGYSYRIKRQMPTAILEKCNGRLAQNDDSFFVAERHQTRYRSNAVPFLIIAYVMETNQCRARVTYIRGPRKPCFWGKAALSLGSSPTGESNPER